MDPISAVTGVATFLAGAGIGRLQRRKKEPPGQEPVCGCKHHLSLHDPATGQCHGQVETRIRPPAGASHYTEWRPCGCRRYVGPEPLTDVRAAPPANDHGKPT